MSEPEVTIVVVTRERFSHSERSLASIYDNTSFPFKLVYIGAGTPSPIRSHLESESQRRGFQLVATPGYLSPNQARNLAMREVRTKYVVFLDNDALVTPGWLDALVGCAEETGAWIVGPLYLIGEIEHQTIHVAGGRLEIKEQSGRRILYDDQYLFDTRVADVRVPLQRRSWDYVEFHCMLTRTDVFERLGPLDERLLSHHEHIDFCWTVRNAGGEVYLEPKAVTSYIPPPPCEWWDLPYFMLRWGESWNLRTVHHFDQKWNVSSVQFSMDTADAKLESTVSQWARAHRRLVAGLKIPGENASRPESSLEEAQLMIALLMSVDRNCFDLKITDKTGEVVTFEPNLDPEQLFDRLPQILDGAERKNLNIMICPLLDDRPHEPALLCVDDVDAEGIRVLRPYVFLILETKPECFQCWLAVARSNWRSAAALRRLIGEGETQPAATVGVHLAGTKNVTGPSHHEDDRYPRVGLVEALSGHLVTTHQLENSKAAPYLWSARIY